MYNPRISVAVKKVRKFVRIFFAIYKRIHLRIFLGSRFVQLHPRIFVILGSFYSENLCAIENPTRNPLILGFVLM